MILTIIGARPQFVKAAVVSKALKEIGIEEEIIHTGQHYDDKMSSVFWDELNIPKPVINLNIGSGNHGFQTAKMIEQIETFILNSKNKIKAILLYGDTNSTLAGAIVAPKLHIPVIHIEAGLRSFNNKMPEEINRIITDRVSDLLFCSSEKSVLQLKSEGIIQNVYNVGDVMYDAFINFGEIAKAKIKLSDIHKFKKNEYNILTLHRPSNTDENDVLQQIISVFEKINKPTIFPVHPRVSRKIKKMNISDNLKLISPLSYFEMLILLQNANKIFTDSGGLQKEAYWANKDCITIREETEWIETLENDFNILTGNNSDRIIDAYYKKNIKQRTNLYGDGKASEKIVKIIKQKYFYD
ncbi:MAG: UDP-N-acetylglucosamine 2-epimerase (non-hydrolyzing) [Bacteroidales bacterium]|nr:UDP-N-acetylglucosamine 2-epimerase (non-hydrolyzing) [Bacteroidales bacterium]